METGERAVSEPRHDNIHMRVHTGVPLPLRNREASPGASQIRDRHTQHHHQPSAVPTGRFRLQVAPGASADATEVPGPVP